MSERLNTAQFKEKVFNYDANKEWSYSGELPAIIDFYADWCGPCKMIAPVLDQISKDYAGKLTVYKVNTDEEQELSAVFGIQSIPTLLFIPKVGKPQAAQGALPKATLEKAIKDVLGVEKTKEAV
jgi:thioredoxin